MIIFPELENYESAPWEKSFGSRVKAFYNIKRQNKKAALLLYQAADTSTFRYRCYNVVQALEDSKEWGAMYFFEKEYAQVEELLDKADILVLTRVKWTLGLDWLVSKAKAKGIPVLFDVDDRVFDLNWLKTLTNTLAVDLDNETAYDFWFAYIGRIQQAAALAEGFITTNDYLAKALSDKFGKPSQIIQNSLNREQLDVSQWLCEKKASAVQDGHFTIGYFSGTPSHINDFLEVYKELLSLLKKCPNIRLSVVGFMEFPPEMQPFISKGQITFTPLVDFVELQRLIASVDVNIVPLVNNTFTNCKSELKFFEAAVVDTVTVATPIHSYAAAIKDGQNGFLCEPGQWYSVLENLYLKKFDTKEICRCAREDTIQTYCGEMFLKRIENSYNFFAKK